MPIRSVCRWQGEAHDRYEPRVALHTRRGLLPRVIDEIRHPYDVPSVLALPIVDGEPPYLD